MPRRIWSAVKWISLGVSIGSIALAFVFVQVRSSQQPSQGDGAADTQTNVEKPLIVERKGERIIWRLQANQAKQQLDGKMHLVVPELTLFAENQAAVPIRSREAWFDPVDRNILFKGDVEVDYQQWQMHSDTLLYNSHEDEMRVAGAFEINSGTLQAKGKNLRLHRQSQQLWVDEGIWIRDESSTWQALTK